MRIVLIDFVFEPQRPGTTGLSDLVWSWAKHLAAMGEDVHIVAPYPDHIETPFGVTVHRFSIPPLGYRNILGHILIILRTWMTLRAIQGIDIIHAPEYLSTGIIGLLTKDIPVIMTTPGNIYERIADNVNPWDMWTTCAYKIAARLSSKYCARIIVTSQSMERWWKYTGAQDRHISEIPLGVDSKGFVKIPRAREILRFESGPRILFVGRLQPENGLRSVIAALPIVVRQIPDIILDVVGDGDERANMVQMSCELGVAKNVRWHGRVAVEQLPLYYSAADIFILPRSSAVTPRVLFEAMACECPVITSDIDGLRQFIEHGRNGFLVDPGNYDMIGQYIITLLHNRALAADIGSAARAYVCQNLDWSIIVRRMRDEVYLPAANEWRVR